MHPATRALPVDVHRDGHQACPGIDAADRAERLQDTCSQDKSEIHSYLMMKAKGTNLG